MRTRGMWLAWVLALGLAAWAEDLQSVRFLSYTVARITSAQAPIVDGKLEPAVWQERAAIESLRRFLGKEVGDHGSQNSRVALLTDGEDLYIGATFAEENMKAIRANPARAPYWNDCIEIYIDPAHDGKVSIQLVVDCRGRRMWEKRFDEGYGWWVDRAWYTLADWESAATRDADAWHVEVRIDCRSFGIDAAPSAVVGFNVCRFRLGAGEEFTAWGFGGSRRQKSLEHWGHLLFPQGDAPATQADAEAIRQALGDLAGLRVEVPLGTRCRLITAAGMSVVPFSQLLEPEVEALRRQLTAAAQAVTAMPAEGTRSDDVRNRFAEIRIRTIELLEGVDDAELDVGRYDRLRQDVAETRVSLRECAGLASLVRLVADAHVENDR